MCRCKTRYYRFQGENYTQPCYGKRLFSDCDLFFSVLRGATNETSGERNI